MEQIIKGVLTHKCFLVMLANKSSFYDYDHTWLTSPWEMNRMEPGVVMRAVYVVFWTVNKVDNRVKQYSRSVQILHAPANKCNSQENGSTLNVALSWIISPCLSSMQFIEGVVIFSKLHHRLILSKWKMSLWFLIAKLPVFAHRFGTAEPTRNVLLIQRCKMEAMSKKQKQNGNRIRIMLKKKKGETVWSSKLSLDE